jgi:Uma2 family endonuclease
VLTNDAGVIVGRGPDTVLGADVCSIAADRLPGGRLSVGSGEIVPDIVIEVVSPGTRSAAVRRKTRRWVEAGARLVWTFFLRRRTVVVSRPDAPDQTLGIGDTLTGEPVLPDFRVPVAALFAE